MYKHLIAAALLLIPAAAFADPTITINGVDVTGITGQKFANVTVEFDANGNVSISAPQYRIVDNDKTPADPTATKVVESAPQAAAPSASIKLDNTLPDSPKPTWLIANFNYPGLLGYNVEVYINKTFVKTIPQGQAQTLVDVSAFLKKGTNLIEYKLDMAADSGTASKANVELFFAKELAKVNSAVEVTGHYAALLINRSDGNKSYAVELIVP